MFIGKIKENIEPTKVATPQIRNPISKAEEGQECLPHNKHCFFSVLLLLNGFKTSELITIVSEGFFAVV